MAANQIECSRLEQRSVIRYLVAEKYKPGEFYMCDLYREACFVKKCLQMGLTWI